MTREKGTRAGFTIIETMLFLALTGLMMVGAMVGIGSNISRTRYRDSVEDIVSVLRDQYEQVNRTQISRRTDDGNCSSISGGGVSGVGSGYRGQSDCNVYGVAITFGIDGGRVFESSTLIGKDIKAYEESLGDTDISSKSEIELLKELGVTNVIDYKPSASSSTVYCKAVNIIEHKKYNWSAKIMHTKTAGHDYVKKATVLIVRSPRDGAVHTYVYEYHTSNKDVFDIYDLKEMAKKTPKKNCHDAYAGSASGSVKEDLAANRYSKKDLNLCVASDDALATYGKRRMIKIASDGHSSSAVSLIDMDDEGNNKCK